MAFYCLECRTAALKKLRFYLPIPKGKDFEEFIFCTSVTTGYLSHDMLPPIFRASVVDPKVKKLLITQVKLLSTYISLTDLVVMSESSLNSHSQVTQIRQFSTNFFFHKH